jgi:hypothetical protein
VTRAGRTGRRWTGSSFGEAGTLGMQMFATDFSKLKTEVRVLIEFNCIIPVILGATL